MLKLDIVQTLAFGGVVLLAGYGLRRAVPVLAMPLVTILAAQVVMRALVERYGPAPTAFLVAPMVGAFFIDFTNAVIITAFLNALA